MSTWHQSKNLSGLQALWTPHESKWKCISDKPNQFASCMTFDTEKEAREYTKHTGCIVINPTRE